MTELEIKEAFKTELSGKFSPGDVEYMTNWWIDKLREAYKKGRDNSYKDLQNTGAYREARKQTIKEVIDELESNPYVQVGSNQFTTLQAWIEAKQKQLRERFIK